MAAAVAFVLAAGPARAQAPAPASDPVQQSFRAAIRLIDLGDFPAAIDILRPLSDSTGAPRVRLELARALYLDHQYRSARAEFLKVYARSDLPYSVRRRIDLYLTELDEKAGYFAPSLGVELNSNPGQLAGPGVYQILGLPLLFLPDHKASAVGFDVAAEGAAPIRDSGVSLVGSAAGAIYTTQGASHVQASLELRTPAKDGWYALGAGYYQQDRRDRILSFDVERMIRIPLGEGRAVSVDATIGRLQVAPDSNLDGVSVQAIGQYETGLGPDAGLTVGAGASYASAQDAIDSRWGALGFVRLVRAATKLRSVLILEGSLSETGFVGVDPFFGRRRRDREATVEVVVLHDKPVHGFFPGVSLTWNRRDSTIPFFGYDRRYFSLQFRRRF